MRVSEITHEDHSWSPLVLHPQLTLIWGDPGQLTELEAVLTNLYSIAGSTVGGTIEYAGYAMPLDQTAVVSLDIHGSGLRTLDLLLLEKSCSRIRAELSSRVDSQVAEIDASVKRLESEAGSLARRRAAASAAMTAVTEELGYSTVIVDDLAERHELSIRRPEELRLAIDAALAAQEQSEKALGTAQELAPSVLEALDSSGATVAALRLGTGCPALAEAVSEAGTSGLLTTDHVAVIEQWLTEVSAGTAETSQQITGMLDEIERLEEEWQTLSARGVEGDPEVKEARERLAEIGVRTANLEELASSGLLADRARSEIDAAHEAADSEEEHRVLELYGFDSYLDYTIALSTRSVGQTIEATVDRARVELVRATDALDVAREQAAGVLGELNERRDGLRQRIRTATGVDPGSLSAEILATIPQLPSELIDAPAVVQAAVESLRGELEESGEVLAECRAELDALTDPETIRAELDAERVRLTELETLLEQANEVYLLTVESLASTESELEALLVEREDLLAESSVLSVDRTGSTATEVAVVIKAVSEQIDVAGTEPTPVMLTDSFSSFGRSAVEALEAVVASAPDVQFLYLTRDDSVASWAKKLRPELGSLVRLGRRRWLGRRLAWPQSRQAEDDAQMVLEDR